MKNTYTAIIFILSVFIASAQTTSFHDYSVLNMAGDTVSLSQYYGKKVMVVNVASFCSYTPQYNPLQQLYNDYAQYNFEIIGFPTDDFLNQGGSDSEIVNTCNNYGVTFPIMEKIHVTGSNIAPIYQWLTQSSLNGVANATVSWNFNKFLIDEAGHWVRHYTQSTQPDDPAITSWIVDSASVVSSLKETQLEDFIEMKSSNPGTAIEFSLKNSVAQNININLYNSQGQLIQNIFTGIADNNRTITSDVSSLASGIYLVRISCKGIQQTVKYVKVK